MDTEESGLGRRSTPSCPRGSCGVPRVARGRRSRAGWRSRPAEARTSVLGQRPDADEQAVDLLELLPLLTPEQLATAPEPLLRALFERFQLQIRYHKPQNRATIRVALSDDSLDGLLASLGDIEGGAAQRDLPVSSAGAVPEVCWGRRLVIEASFEVTAAG
jgi:hypothetical protein